jgi:small GTP-binding protein
MEILERNHTAGRLSSLSDALLGASKDMESFPPLLSHLMRFRALGNDLQIPPIVVVMGAFNAGKSTLLNALLKQSLLNMHVLPATATVTMLRNGEPGQILGHSDEYEPRKWPLSRLSSLSAEGDPDTASIRKSLAYLEVPLDHGLLNQITLVDTPGLNSPNETHTRATEDFVHRAHAVLWISSCLQPLNEQERSWIERLPVDMRVMVVINQIDQLDPEEDSIARIIERIQNNLSRPQLSVAAVSAKQALEGILSNDIDRLRASQWQEFRSKFDKTILQFSPDEHVSRAAGDLAKIIDPLCAEIARTLETADALKIKAKDVSRYRESLAEQMNALREAEYALFHAADAIDAVMNLHVKTEWLVPERVASKEEVLLGAIVDLTTEQSGIDEEARSVGSQIQRWERDCAQWNSEREAYLKSGLFGGEPVIFKGKKKKLALRMERLEELGRELNGEVARINIRKETAARKRKRLEADCRAFLEEIIAAIRAVMARIVNESRNIVSEQKLAAGRLKELEWVRRFAFVVKSQKLWEINQKIESWPNDAASIVRLPLDRFDAIIDSALTKELSVALVAPLVEPAALEHPKLEPPNFRVHVPARSFRKTMPFVVAALVLALFVAFVIQTTSHQMQIIQPEAATVKSTSTSAPASRSDDHSTIASEFDLQGLVPEGTMYDIAMTKPTSLHLQRVSCKDLQNPCNRLFVFVGSRAVWSEDLDPATTLSAPIAEGPGVFHIEVVGPELDGQRASTSVQYSWDGTQLTRTIQPSVTSNDDLSGSSQPSESSPVTSNDAPRVLTEFPAALENWEDAMKSNNPDAIAACYAPIVDRYFLQQDWSQSQIRAYLSRWFQGGAKSIHEFSFDIVSNRFTQADAIEVTGMKRMIITDPSGSKEVTSRSELHFKRQMDGTWKITSERDFRQP